MSSTKHRTPTTAVRVLTRRGLPLDVAWAARDAAVETGVPLARIVAVGEAESGFRNVWGHDPGKWREDGPLTAASVRRYFGQPAAERPNGAGVWQLTYEGYQRQAEALGGLHLLGPQATICARVLEGLPDHGATARGLARYNGSGTAATAYGARVHARQAWWASALRQGGVR